MDILLTVAAGAALLTLSLRRKIAKIQSERRLTIAPLPPTKPVEPVESVEGLDG